MNEYRQLRQGEIDILIEQGCRADDFESIRVAGQFDATRIHATRFSGQIRIGALEKHRKLTGGIVEPAGIRNARLHNCVIGNNVYINNVHQVLANMVIAEEAFVWNVDGIVTDTESMFGNGTEVAVINEAGGREVAIFDELSGQLAYLMATCRHEAELLKKISIFIADYCNVNKSDVGYVGREARICNCGMLKNIRIGPAAVLEGVHHLSNGTINSSSEDPVYVGPGVNANAFIFSAGAQVTDGCILEKCFVGQGVHLKKQFTAENAVFLANSDCFQGEACSVLAGPYTVTHHKSTLLIAGLVSFFNAGSGTNQSNHMYKLGPGQQGILERGCKTASDGYIMWPARVGPFTLIKGRHYSNIDSSDLPFSYLLEFEGQSVLMPGYNLASVGTLRDDQKWRGRDRRKTSRPLDLIIPDVFSPYTAQKMIRARERLEALLTDSDNETDPFEFGRAVIRKSSLENALRFYRLGIDAYLGQTLINRLAAASLNTRTDLETSLAPKTGIGTGEWVDLAGLLAPRSLVESLIQNIENGSISDMQQIQAGFTNMFTDYRDYEWTWVSEAIESEYLLQLDKINPKQIVEILDGWLRAEEKLYDLRRQDAEKEFSPTAKVGFGLDGNVEIKNRDFAAVRGSLSENSFIAGLESHLNEKRDRAQELIDALNRL